MVVGIIGLLIAAFALLVAYLSWRAAQAANTKSDAANTIASQALSMTRTEFEQGQADRTARAELKVDVSLDGYTPNERGITEMPAGGNSPRVRIAIRNAGDRDAGETRIAMKTSILQYDDRIRWVDGSNRPLPERPEYTARVDDNTASVLPCTLGGISRNLGATLLALIPIEVPLDGFNEYVISVHVEADHADTPADAELRLKVGPKPDAT